MKESKALIFILALLTSIPLYSCRTADRSRLFQSETPSVITATSVREWAEFRASPSECANLRALLRGTGGGAVDIYEDDYASMIRSGPPHPARQIVPMDELVAIRAYTHRFWSDTNQALWAGTEDSLPAADQTVLRCAVSGLNRMAPLTVPVYRQTRLPAAVVDQHVEGSRLTYHSFTSTTRSVQVLNRFSGNTRFKIEGTSGRDIAWLSEHPDEEETLFRPGTCFQVITRDPAPCTAGVSPPCWFIHMKEVDGSECRPGE